MIWILTIEVEIHFISLLICLPRQVLLGEVAHAKRPVGRPRLRFKNCAKRDMTEFNIDHRHWERLAEGGDEWRKSINEGCHIYDEAWLGVLAQKRIRMHTAGSSGCAVNVIQRSVA
ncbi:jg1846 [Pararge aegeria aegeria]|uniref:Jg1846 protein n=1 Tax=Pararge aegeria aegeria TaxID=348720 RepID=A0A8S4RF49_9NEOP|nr:jg1846 [Pararge aegeria aegeria]